jgi:imidazolonepropionase
VRTKITNIGSLITWDIDSDSLHTLSNIELLIEDGVISKITENISSAEEEIDADGALITPGFIDSHTHPIFSGNRAAEFELRASGKSYEEIAQKGGGIISSITAVRNASEDKLFDECQERMNFFLAHGTTTIEAKSGYGLTVEDELKSLRVLKRISKSTNLDIVPTLMGAHAVPPEFATNQERYIDLICDEMIPAVAEEKLAQFCDVFCEVGYFTVEQSRRILETSQHYGLIPRLHADEFVDSGAAELAAELGAVSADHLMAVSDEGINALAKSGVIATLLPGTTLYLGKTEYAPGRRLIDAGCEVAIASDFNPGSCTIQSMPIIFTLANLYCGLTLEECFKASTINAAKAIKREKTYGLIKEGYKADLLFWEVSQLEEIPYWAGSDRLLNVMKAGELLD